MAALDVGMPSPWFHGLFVDMHIAVEASDKLGWRYAGVQLEGLAPRAYVAMRVSWGWGGSRLTSCIHIQPQRPGLASSVGPGLLQEKVGRGQEWEGTQAVSINKHEYQWDKTGEICRRSIVTSMLPLVSSVEKAAGIIYREGHWELRLLLLFFLYPSHFYISQLCWSLGWVTEVGPSCSALQGWESWSLISLFFSG